MKALVLHAAGDARIEERPEPTAPGSAEVTLRIVRAGLCGTDATEFAAGPVMTPLRVRHPNSGAQGPVVLGHEFIGVVEAAGTAVDRLQVGTRVAAGAGVWCGSCDWCRRGQTNLCASYWTFGLSADGGLTERITVPAAMLHPVAGHVSDDNAALAQPLAVGIHAVQRSRVRAGDVVVVHGVGAIGSFVVAGAAAAGAGAVVAVDVDPRRLQTAAQLGATHTVDAGEQDPLEVVRELTGSLADVVVEASGLADGMPRVQRLVRRGGTVLLVGLPKKAVSFDAVDLILREVDVMTTVAHVCDTNLPAALDLLAARDLASLLVDKVVPLEHAVEDALVPMAQGAARGKYLVDPGDGGMSAGELFSEERSAEVVVASFARTPDPRLREVLTSLVHHLHAFVKDVELTEEEWGTAIDFLTRTGHMSDDLRQEFILLSDVLGVSMLVETLNHRTGGTATESTVLGPFHMVESPLRELGDDIALDGKGTPCLVSGRVVGRDGEPLAGASVDVWQTNEDGFYDVQQPDVQPPGNLRGMFTADTEGRFWFRSVVPRFYPIPDDGPVGQLLAATGRHPNRPAHLHFIVASPGHRPVTTHVFVADSPYLDSDAVFGVKESLVRDVPEVDDPARAAEVGLANPFRTLTFDLALLPVDQVPPTAEAARAQPTVVRGGPS